jgi:tetratricopeptide (TPR) repeat protein
MTTVFYKIPLLTTRLLVPMLCVGALLLSACSKSPAQIEKKDLGLGEHYLSEGKVNEAIIEFQNVLKVNPRSVKGRLGLATSFMKKGWTAEAVLEFQEVAKEAPLSLDAHLALARYGVNSGQWKAVEPEIAAVQKIDPSNVEGLTFDGERELALGHEKEAESSFNKALSLSPGAVPALVGMGDLFRHENQPEKSSSFYREALARDPKNSRALTGLGFLEQKAGKTDEAKENFRKAMEADKADLRSRIIFANFLAGEGNARQAIALLKAVPAKGADIRIPVKIAEYEVMLGENAKAIALMHPLELQKIPLPDIYLVLAKAYQGSGRLGEAIGAANHLASMDGVPPIMKIVAARVEIAGRNLGKAKKILDSISEMPHLPVSFWQTLGQLEENQKNPAEAINVLDKGLENYPDNNILLLSLADAQALKNNYKESVRILDRLLQKDPKNPAIIGRLGNLKVRKIGPKAEVAYYREMSRKYPDVTGIEFLYLLSLASSKHLPDAIREAKTYIGSNPSNQQVRFLLAQFELQSGKRSEAITLYKSILDSNSKNLQALHALADQELAEGHFPEAESLFRRSLAIQPDDAGLEVGLGEALLAEHQKDAAEKAFHQALEINPNQPLALLESAKYAILSGRSQEALTDLTPLMKANFPVLQKAQLQWLWGLAAENNRDLKGAIDSFKKATQLDPKNAAYHASLGDLFANLSEWDSALPELDRSLSLNPNLSLVKLTRDWVSVNRTIGHPEAEKLRKIVAEASGYQKDHDGDLTSGLIEARADILLNDLSSAQKVFDQILAKNPDNPTALLGKAAILLSQNHPKEARSVIDHLLANHPNDVQGNLMMASIDQKEGNARGEIDRLVKVHESHPDWVQPAVALAGADLDLGRFEEAKSIAFSLHEEHPSLPIALYLLGNAEMGLKNYREAMRNFRILAKSTKMAAPIYNLMSVAAMRLDEKDKARKYLDLALKASPNDPAVLNNMAFFLAYNMKDLSKALEYAKKAVKLAPQPFVQDTLGYVLFKMGSYEKAEPHFKTAYDAHFRDPEFLYHMGMNEWKLGKNEQASSHLRKAVLSRGLSPEEQEKAQNTLRKLSS